MLKTEGYENSELFMALTPKNGVKASKLYSYKPIDGTGDFHWSRNHTAYRLNQEGVLELMGNNVPRIDYTNTCPELLIEKESENLCLTSQEFDSNVAWQKIRGAVTANTTIAPDGTLTADTFVYTSGGFLPALVNQVFTFSSNTKYSFSVFAKILGDTNTVVLSYTDVSPSFTGGACTFDLLNETTTNFQPPNNSLTSSIKNIGNGWYRLIIDFTTSNSTNFNYIQININSTSTSNEVAFWGAQLEESDYATSYIPTTTTTQTRPQDICYNTANTFGDTAWSIVMRVRLNNIGSNTFEPLVSLNDGSTDNYFCIYTDSNPKLYFDWYNNPDQLTLDTSDLSNAIYNIGISYDDATGDYIIVLDGSLEFAGNVGVSLAGAFTGSFIRMDLGSIAGTGSPDADGIIGIQYYDSALTQTDLENLTTA